MKIIAIGDTHGREFWRYIAHTQTFDKFVFIGDYFDSYDLDFEHQARNFISICQYKRDNPGKVVLLLGNHDIQYFPVYMDNNDHCNGFQETYRWQIRHLMETNKDILQMAYKHDNFLFTHAGVTATWVRAIKMLLEIDGIDLSDLPIDEFINEVWKYTPLYFKFAGDDPYGDDVTQSPVWVRPRSLKRNAYDYENLKQVVGHTNQNRLKVEKNRYFFIDTLGTTREYLVIEDRQYKIEKV